MKQIIIFITIIVVLVKLTHAGLTFDAVWNTSYTRPQSVYTASVDPLPSGTNSSIWCNETGLATGSTYAYSDAQGGCGAPYNLEINGFVCTRYLKFFQFNFDLPTNGANFPTKTQCITMTGMNFSFDFGTSNLQPNQDWFVNWNLLFPTSTGLQNIDTTKTFLSTSDSFYELTFFKFFTASELTTNTYYPQDINHDYFGWRGAFKYYDSTTGNFYLKITSILTSIQFSYSSQVLSATPLIGTVYTKVNITFLADTVLLNGNYGGTTSTYAILWKCYFGSNSTEARILSTSMIQCWPTIPNPNTTVQLQIQFHKNLDIRKDTGYSFQFLEYCPGYPSDTCGGHGTCDPVEAVCTCQEGWAPPNCTEPACIEGGYPVNCSFHGTCNNQTNLCECDPGYDGWDCEIDICIDDLQNCSGNGTCLFEPSHCNCNPANNGTYCQDDKCNYLDCGDHGTCVQGYCDCEVPYDGYYCEIDVCNGTFPGCNDNGQAFMDCTCVCNQGYYLPYCETNWCTYKDCNHGTCDMNTGTCKCDDNYSGDDCSTRDTAAHEVKAGVVAGATIGAAIAAGAIALLIFILVRRHNRRDRWKQILSLPVFSIETLFGKDFFLSDSDRKRAKSRSMQRAYLDLEELLLENLDLVQAIFTDTETKTVSPIHRAILYVFEASGEAVKLLKYFIKLEVDSCTDSDLLFRGTNVASKLWSGYCHLAFGVQYLHDTISYPIYQLMKKQDLNKLQIDSSKIGGDEDDEDKDNSPQIDISVNKYRLMSAAQMIFDAIRRAADDIPIQFRLVLSYTRTLVEQKFPDNVHQSLGGLMILRYFSPAFTACDQFGIMDEEELTDEMVRMLVLIAKVLQNLANGALFGVKEEYMIVLNDFIETNLEPMSEYLDKISLVTENEDEDMINPSPLPKDVYPISLAIIHEYLAINHHDIVRALDTIVTDEDRRSELATNLEEVLQGLGKPIDLTSGDYL
ncbi:ras gtpase-activating protein [Anaeramoeba ignava]|uniref:Ras gtpase-activating protein n=1 Tax=Anaeramoeba ignava TaxID=1746090 RepID=A0A9Q0RGL5_ANAIG|nr:ras gtpase-activating protein [Anaeramoeba ignava]